MPRPASLTQAPAQLIDLVYFGVNEGTIIYLDLVDRTVKEVSVRRPRIDADLQTGASLAVRNHMRGGARCQVPVYIEFDHL
jgi:hypothetical protein